MAVKPLDFYMHPKSIQPENNFIGKDKLTIFKAVNYF